LIDSIELIDLIACPVKRDPVYRDISRGIDLIETPGATPTSNFQLLTSNFIKMIACPVK
jgi:hypothetical protein